jgi:hypothetical protein
VSRQGGLVRWTALILWTTIPLLLIGTTLLRRPHTDDCRQALTSAMLSLLLYAELFHCVDTHCTCHFSQRLATLKRLLSRHQSCEPSFQFFATTSKQSRHPAFHHATLATARTPDLLITTGLERLHYATAFDIITCFTMFHSIAFWT